MEAAKSLESLPGISKAKNASKKVKPNAGRRGKNSAEGDAGSEEVDEHGMKNIEGSQKVTSRNRNRKNTSSQQVEQDEVDIEPKPAGVETSSLGTQVALTILDKISNLTTAVEAMNEKMSELDSKVEDVKKMSSMKDDLEDHIENFTTFDLDTTSEIQKLKKMQSDMEDRVVKEFDLKYLEIVGTRDSLDTLISTAVGGVKQSIAAQPQGNQVLMMANSGGSASSDGSDSHSNGPSAEDNYSN